jgi:hypothetical protein
VRNKGEHVEIHMRADSEDGGLLIVIEEPLELTIVNIAGKINMDELRELQGHMGVPNIQSLIGNSPTAPATTAAPSAPSAATTTPAAPAPAATRER